MASSTYSSPSIFFHSDEIAHLNHPAVALGNFDGVHLGHQNLFQHLSKYARAHHVDAVALTFEPHPIAFFRPESPSFQLQTLPLKKKIAEHYVDRLIAIHFDAIASWSPEEFVTRVLVEGLAASCVMVGNNFNFGKNRSGNVETLRTLAAQYDIDVTIINDVYTTSIPPLSTSGATSESHGNKELISSSSVRKAIKNGDLATANALLGRPWELYGTVIHGDALGRTLGFPTANIDVPSTLLLPPPGIYATYLTADDTTYRAASYIGTRPTFQGETLRIESFVIDAPDDFSIYGEEVSLQFIARTRPDQAFESAEALVTQMANDVDDVKKALSL